MTTLFNLGSINQDLFFHLERFAEPGETITANSVSEALGGKGMNQSIAMAKSNANVIHIGAMGMNTPHLENEIERLGVSLDHIEKSKVLPTGSAIIALDSKGENFILLNGGANQSIPDSVIEAGLQSAQINDWLILQNETNGVDLAVEIAKQKGMKIALSAAPFDADQVELLLTKVDLIAVNEYEAKQIEAHIGEKLDQVSGTDFLVTYGAKGSEFISEGNTVRIDSFPVSPIDTTGAGDTFLGAFMSRWILGTEVSIALQYASAASAIQVTRQGAATAIPDKQEVEAFLKENL